MLWRSCSLVSLAMLMLAGAPAAADPPLDVSGEWYFDVLTSPSGPGRREVLFRQEGERVIGFIESESATGRFVGRLVGDDLSFTAVLEFGGQPMAADYRARVDADTMAGTIDFGLYGKATFVGFRGRRPQTGTTGPETIEGRAGYAGIEVARVGDHFGVAVDGVLVPELVSLPAGRFRMGSDSPLVKPEYGADFAHVHPVAVSAFRLGRFPVTNAQYLAFTAATGRPPPLPPRGWGDYGTLYPNHPVVNVNFAEAAAYAAWLAAVTGEPVRLPTEAEWEYAARAGRDGANFVFGDEWQVAGANTATWHIGRPVDRAGWKDWWDGDGERLARSRPMTSRVGTFAPNAWGLYDMVGNVWEWVADWYQADYYRAAPGQDPTGPPDGDEKVLRGCSWYNQPDVCFIATRDRYAPDRRLYYNGFRVAAGLEP